MPLPSIKIEFKKDFRVFKAGEIIEWSFRLRPIILVGDQGTGKSTLIQILEGLHTECATVTMPKVIKIAHDYERDNIRVASGFDPNADLMSIWASHGQAMALASRSVFNQLKAKTKDGSTGMLLLDEPDAGLSIRSACALNRALTFIAGQGHWVIAAIHSPYAMGTEVYDVELRKFVDPAEFLKRMVS